MRSLAHRSPRTSRGLRGTLVALFACCQLADPVSAAAQTREVAVEFGASQVLPPSSAVGEAARFLVGGLRGQWTATNGSGILASLQGGRSTDAATGGNFVSGQVAGSVWRSVGRGWSVGARARGLGFWVGSPFPYRAGALEGGPSILLVRPNLSLRIDGTAGLGQSRIEVQSTVPTDGWGDPWRRGHHMGNSGQTTDSVAITVLDADLWRYGSNAELLTRVGPVVAGVAGGSYRSVGGPFSFAGLRIMGGGNRLAMGARLDSWWTPYGQEATGGLWVSLTLGGGWDLRGFVGKTEPDPLTLAASSGGGGGILVGRRLAGWRGGRGSSRLHETVGRTDSGATIRFNVRPPSASESVYLMGDFTLWEARAMERDGDQWTLEVIVPEGLHHFGFLVDGEWFIPEEASDTVPDEWGRRSATLLVEGGGAR